MRSHSEPRTLVTLVRERAQHTPERELYRFIDAETEVLSFGDLERRARSIALVLAERAEPKSRVLLLYPPGLEYIASFFGCLFAGLVPVPLYPPEPSKQLDRIKAIVADAEPALALTTEAISKMAEVLCQGDPLLGRLSWLATDTVPVDSASAWRPLQANADDLALLQYTSGSTGRPKGVMLSHRNLCHNLEHIQRCFEHSAESQGVIWLPPYHDMGLIGGILQPLYAGFPVALMSPLTFLKRPLAWLRAISEYRATTSGGPDFAYQLCTRTVSSDQVRELDLSSWRVAFTGAEPVRATTLARFSEKFGAAGFSSQAFYPCYGLAEATLIVSGAARPVVPVSVHRIARADLERGHASDALDGTPLVGNGTTLPDQVIRIVDPKTRERCSEQVVGEIWVSGNSVAQGYWRDPALTESVFRARLSNDLSRPFLRTGDLGYLREEQLFVTGRIKDLVIIRGRNFFAEDLELTVEQSHPALRPGRGVAFSVEIAGEERLIVAHEVSNVAVAPVRDLVERIRAALVGEHGLRPYEVLLLPPKAIPRTSSGKKQRFACRTAYLENAWQVLERTRDETDEQPLSTQASVSPQSESVREIAAKILRRRAEELDVRAPLPQLGFDSLLSVIFASALEKAFGVTLNAAELLGSANLNRISEELTGSRRGQESSAPSELLPGEYPASVGQAALWFLCQSEAASVAYNLATALRIHGRLDTSTLDSALRRIFARHPALRTTFAWREGALLQRVHPPPEAVLELRDRLPLEEPELLASIDREVLRAFDLEQGPLARAVLFVRSEAEHVLLWLAHHTVMDFWSSSIVLDELKRAYAAESQGRAPALSLPARSYVDFVRYQTEKSESPALLSYWQGELLGPLPVLDLLTDRPRPPVQRHQGATRAFAIEPSLMQRVIELARAERATPYNVLVAVFEVLLERHSGQSDILLGTIASGRTHPGFAETVGYFVNPVVLRAELGNDPTFRQLLADVRERVLGALKHQDYPFPLLVQKLNPERDPSRPPIFQVLFTYQKDPRATEVNLAPFALNEPGGVMHWGELRVESVHLPRRTSQFELTLTLIESDGRCEGAFEYNTALFDGATIESLTRQFLTLLEASVALPERRISELPLLTAAERAQVLERSSEPTAPKVELECLHRLFERQASHAPEAVALIEGNAELSYAELDARSNQLARLLLELGVVQGSLVGLFCQRSAELVVAILGILKAGAAYVPLDPAYPAERLAYILEDAPVQVLLTQSALAARLPATGARVVQLDAEAPAIRRQSTEGLASSSQVDQLAYVIFTSGSTGRPKGVAIEHRNAAVLLDWAHHTFSKEECARVLASTSICFDLSVFELFLPLTCGGSVVLVDNVLELATSPYRDGVTLLNSIPSAVNELVRANHLPASVRCVCLAGEPLPSALVDLLYAHPQVERVFNLYGPSECTTYSTFVLLQKAPRDYVPIGRPITNTRAYVLDERLEPVPVGVRGELFLGGAGVARGYIGRPDLTRERFTADPFAPGERIYRTGDVVRWRADGNLEFFGRFDHQIKLRGYRIELGEIESALRAAPGVSDVAVIMREDRPSERQLVAYVVSALESPTAEVLEALRASLRRRLPEYMIPSTIVRLDALPLSPHGKLDRRRLPKPEYASPLEGFVPPRGNFEHQLTEIWRDVLGLERVSVNDSFFSLGGHSLLLARVQNQIEQRLKRSIALPTLLEYPTVRALAEYLASGETDTKKGPDLARKRAEQQRSARKRRVERSQK